MLISCHRRHQFNLINLQNVAAARHYSTQMMNELQSVDWTNVVNWSKNSANAKLNRRPLSASCYVDCSIGRKLRRRQFIGSKQFAVVTVHQREEHCSEQSAASAVGPRHNSSIVGQQLNSKDAHNTDKLHDLCTILHRDSTSKSSREWRTFHIVIFIFRLVRDRRLLLSRMEVATHNIIRLHFVKSNRRETIRSIVFERRRVSLLSHVNTNQCRTTRFSPHSFISASALLQNTTKSLFVLSTNSSRWANRLENDKVSRLCPRHWRLSLLLSTNHQYLTCILVVEVNLLGMNYRYLSQVVFSIGILL